MHTHTHADKRSRAKETDRQAKSNKIWFETCIHTSFKLTAAGRPTERERERAQAYSQYLLSVASSPYSCASSSSSVAPIHSFACVVAVAIKWTHKKYAVQMANAKCCKQNGARRDVQKLSRLKQRVGERERESTHERHVLEAKLKACECGTSQSCSICDSCSHLCVHVEVSVCVWVCECVFVVPVCLSGVFCLRQLPAAIAFESDNLVCTCVCMWACVRPSSALITGHKLGQHTHTHMDIDNLMHNLNKLNTHKHVYTICTCTCICKCSLKAMQIPIETLPKLRGKLLYLKFKVKINKLLSDALDRAILCIQGQASHTYTTIFGVPNIEYPALACAWTTSEDIYVSLHLE